MSQSTEVLVVGAGPSGLMAAVCLARLGVDVIVIDGKGGPTRESRALALQARSMELYDQLGLVDRVLAESDRAPQIVPGYGTRTLHPLSFAGFGRKLTPYPGIYVFEQSRNERLLVDAFAGGDLRWRHELRSLEYDEQGVVATADAPGGEVTIRAHWCIGADGASSLVRESLGIAFEGSTNPLQFFVADALDAEGLVEHSVNMRASRDDFMLAFPMGEHGHYRLLGIVDEADQRPEDSVRARLSTEFGVGYTRSSWFATYRVHHRLAARFRAGPVFLVGDAGHVHSPAGAQGMNTGLQDAHNLACKLADVIRGRADPVLLDRYEAERRPVARRLVSTTDAGFQRLTSTGRVARFVRWRVVPLVAPLAVRVMPRIIGAQRIYGYVAQLRIHYWASDAEREQRRGRRDPVVGRRLQWSGDNFEALRTLDWQVHGYGAPAAPVEATARMLGIRSQVFGVDPFGRLRRDRLYLVRPDGFVAAAAPVAKAVERFGDYFRGAGYRTL